jgi:hypothetical protein
MRYGSFCSEAAALQAQAPSNPCEPAFVKPTVSFAARKAAAQRSIFSVWRLEKSRSLAFALD